MKNNDEFLNKIRTKLTGSENISGAAIALNITRSALSRVLNGKAELSIELALRIESIYGLNADELLTAQLKNKIDQARKNFYFTI